MLQLHGRGGDSMYGMPDFTVGGALRQTADIVKHHLGTLLAISALLYALPVGVFGALPRLGLVPSATSLQAAVAAGRPVTQSDLAALTAFGSASAVVVVLASMLATGAVIWVAFEGLHGRSATLGGGAARSLRVLLPNVGMTIVYGLAIALATLLLIVPGVMLFVRWSAALPTLVVERAGVLGSLRRSRDLTRGHRWAILGFLLLVYLFTGVAFVAVRFGGSALAARLGGDAGFAVGLALGFVVNAAVSTLNGAAIASLYFELRRASEGVLSSETAAAFA